MFLLEVYFESDKEAIRFCEYLFQINKKIELHWKVNTEWGNHLQLDYQVPGSDLMGTIAEAMVGVFVTHRLTGMLDGIIKDYYYYTNSDEIERIMDLSYRIVTGDDDENQIVRNNKDPCRVLYSLFSANIKNSGAVHFDSIVNFQSKVFKDQLADYVGLAIDEFKREEDHQAFIDMLRSYVMKRKSLFHTIHVVQGEPFVFFKPDGKRLSRIDLRKLMQQEPLYVVGLDEDELNLAPLIAMSPESINIYGDSPSDPKTLTVINVFQERVTFEPVSRFPFPYQLTHK
ncbi:sporulation protein YtxC [Lentibacillus cibarius]|uniref:sporulation protein YtxC n=1 Tax=Lentibacillus cibarius TaxID=2583219 RepID=UPI001F196150|nr:sporulation protein YtxC [Lentibacillus cibarius]